jgi:glutathione S-transferase
MVALMRYRRIPYAVHWTPGKPPKPHYPRPKVALLPTFYFPNEEAESGVEAVIDSTPIIRRLEREYEGRSVIPNDPVMAFFNELIEDYADEWMTKIMFHYRWAHAEDYANAGPMLAYWSDVKAEDDVAKETAESFSRRQYDRLYVVGSNEVTSQTIEASYARLIEALDATIGAYGFILGGRPSSADFAVYGQLTQLGMVEPTPSRILRDTSHRVRAWLDIMEDLSGFVPSTEPEKDWFDVGERGRLLKPLLTEIGRTYAPFLIANYSAIKDGAETFEAEIDGRPWSQPVFPYQAKCLIWLREAYEALDEGSRSAVDTIIGDTGCEPLFNGV